MNNINLQQPLETSCHPKTLEELQAQVESLQQRLVSSESRQHRLLDAIPQIAWRAKADGLISYWNRRWQEYTGVEPGRALGLGFTRAIHPEDHDRVLSFHRQVLAKAHLTANCSSCFYETELRLLRADGTYHWFIAKAEPVFGENSQILEWVGTYTDIDSTKLSQEALGKSEKRYQLMAENCTDLISRHTPAGVYLYASPASHTLLGYEPDELIGRDVHEFFHPEDKAALKRTQTDGLNQPSTYTLCYRIRRKDGNYIWFETSSRCVRHPDRGTVEEIISVSRDITERKRAEAEIYTLNRELDQLVRKQSVQLDAAKQLKEELIGREQVARSQVVAAQERFAIEQKRTESALYFLIEASTLLAASLDYETTLENLAELVVPYLGDWCAINIIDADESCRCVAVAHKDPSREPLVRELQRRYPADSDGTYSYLKRLRCGETDQPWQISVGFDICDTKMEAIANDAEHLELLQALNFRSYMCLPIRFGKQTFGSILLVLSDRVRRYTQADMTLAEDLGRRAALALDKAQLYRQAQETSKNLSQVILVLDEQQQQLRTLQRLTNLVNQRLADLPGLLQVMVDAVCDSIPGAQFCLIVLNNPSTGQLELTATAGMGTENLPMGKPLATEDGLLSQVFSTGKCQLIRQENHSPTGWQERQGTWQNPKHLHTLAKPAAVYAVAIESAQAGRLGVMATGSWDDSGAFDLEMWQNLLVAVGEQAAIAINNAQLINILEEREEVVAVQNHILARQNQELATQREQIQLQNLQLLEAARLKSQFLATMSHELRTPLNVIIGFAQLLLRQRPDPLTSSQTKMADRILDNGKNLLMLIDDILALSHIEAGLRGIKREMFDVVQLARITVEQFNKLASDKNLTLDVYIDMQNRNLFNDRACLRQVLINLVSNAIKFTESGSVRVEVCEQPDDRVIITVEDTGIGIAETEMAHIFEAFRQVDQTLARKYPGTGLGLAITDSLVRLMNGTITVTSRLGEGSTFQVELPRKI
ncbi:MAG: PAS domain S-box protein [Microcoleus vaginatus WJT46-NPBG5]|jgi:PAS domain S-box-containing protein|nr:PAS domain S-box protein [Microcoleus vaginatus WJT46-NPBG5]